MATFFLICLWALVFELSSSQIDNNEDIQQKPISYFMSRVFKNRRTA